MRAAPAYEEHEPAPALRAYVACYWTLLGDQASGHRVLPDGCMDLLFDLTAAPGADATLIGTMSAPLLAPAAARARLFGVRFRPGEAFGFVGVPAGEIKDRVLENLANVDARLTSSIAANLGRPAPKGKPARAVEPSPALSLLPTEPGLGLELDVVAIVLLGGVSIFGGKGTLAGVVLAVIAFAALQNALLLTNFNQEATGIVIGALLLVSVFAPNAGRLWRAGPPRWARGRSGRQSPAVGGGT